jgi:hypothetical protein
VLEPASTSEDVVKVPPEITADPAPVAHALEDSFIEVLAPQNGTVTGDVVDVTVVPKVAITTQDDGLQVPEESPDTPQPTQKKKKTHRGTRGGVKHQKNRRKDSDDAGPVKGAATIDEVVRDAQKLGEPSRLEPDVQTLPNGVTEVSGPILQLGSLQVNTEKLIGTGSNGTMVFEGRFDGREVAVKRMLIQFFDIASQETKLLRESDDHPNGTYTLAYLNTLLT